MDKESINNSLEIKKTFILTGIICVGSSLLLSFTALLLKPIQDRSIEFDKNKELLIAARIIDREGSLIGDNSNKPTTEKEILNIIQSRILTRLVDEEGNLRTFQESGLQEKEYLELGERIGFHSLPKKLIYLLLPPPEKNSRQPEAFIIPVRGKGLWGPMEGYLCLEEDCNTVRGVTWHKHQETPGLGSFISDPKWQSRLIGKKIFLVKGGEHSPLGLYVVQGGVENQLSTSTKKYSSVDGVSGATLTGIGVTQAYQTTLEAYRTFLMKQKDASR
ncbi:NADH:ubiquinone reductase (Na(+)-transporting) subunit C [Candidatus Similichlamydia epinepheli]|uniref:NADH:ubiquinone reductase (Na(+)-transporting) subunit C n=1 Tax=Candidatus Similichlamydia epinepheli TaxID=1903953 RepID=UPI000D358C32|nr:NADH:ubiquinone reductase (Na(+)-transporting) subunit C [Candidatus Similichlamydia epinepheli]